jgi:hypothetical protein
VGDEEGPEVKAGAGIRAPCLLERRRNSVHRDDLKATDQGPASQPILDKSSKTCSGKRMRDSLLKTFRLHSASRKRRSS